MGSTIRKHQYGFRLGSLLLAVITCVLLTSSTLAHATQPKLHEILRTQGIGVISHRGAAAVAPENTLAAVQVGIEQEADFIEVDVRLTKDRVPVLFHDAKLDRTTNGEGKLRDHTYDEIRHLDAGSWFGPDYTSERIPTFVEFLDLFQESNAYAFIELKGRWAGSDIAALHEAINERRLDKRVVLQSFETNTMRLISLEMPHIVRVLLAREITDDTINFVSEHRMGGLGAQLALFQEHEDLISKLGELGIGAFAYTLNDEEAWNEAEAIGVDLIVTDLAHELQLWLKE